MSPIISCLNGWAGEDETLKSRTCKHDVKEPVSFINERIFDSYLSHDSEFITIQYYHNNRERLPGK